MPRTRASGPASRRRGRRSSRSWRRLARWSRCRSSRCRPGAERTVVHPAGWLRSPSPYSYAIKSGDTVFLSGLVSRGGRDNAPVAGDVPTQTKVIMEVAGEILEAAGLTHANIVAARIYLPTLDSFQPMNGAYREFFPADPPARATVQAGARGAAVRRRDHVRRLLGATRGDQRRRSAEPESEHRNSGRPPRLPVGRAGQHPGHAG